MSRDKKWDVKKNLEMLARILCKKQKRLNGDLALRFHGIYGIYMVLTLINEGFTI